MLRRVDDVWVPPIKELTYWSRALPSDGGRKLRWRRHLPMRSKSTVAALPILRSHATHPPRPDLGFDLRYFVGRSSPAWYRRLFDAAPGDALRGELSPSYWSMSDAAIASFASELPDTKVVVTLRDPIDRAWSMAVKVLARDRGVPLESISEADLLRWVAVRPERLLLDAGNLERWYAALGETRVQVAWFDDLTGDPHGYLTRILGHIGSQGDPTPLVELFHKPINPAARDRRPPAAFEQAVAARCRDDLGRLRGLVDDPSSVDRWIRRAESVAP